MKKIKAIIKSDGKKYTHNDKKVKSSMSTAFIQKDQKEFRAVIKVLSKR